MSNPFNAAKLISEEESLAIIRAAIDAAEPAGQSAKDLDLVLRWAVKTRVNAAALDLVLKGEIGTFMRNGEIIFRARS